MEEEPWLFKPGDVCQLSRKVSYTKAATKLVKAVRATEKQAYLKADGKSFAIFIEVSTPEVPYGNAFQVELLYKLMPGPEFTLDVESTRLVVSWGVNFSRRIMMKGMIEGGVHQGLKESFDRFINLLARDFPVLESKDQLTNKDDRIVATPEDEIKSDWKLAVEYLCNFTAFATTCFVLYLFIHIFLCEKSALHGLEFNGLDLPDSLMELIVGGIVFLQLERAYYMASHFLRARRQRGTRHKSKAQGDGWILTML
ncbi:hypothetical protein MLD38_039424 [Melastoma candidum]|uniref:Uncharacterized protein n=1 Tax=Melastoma candidum TaxID=119954 RepID=A0ACB9L217_9MYRT|nr:hypothetical protein MLD38_039424 [Melastoma candidum]